MILVGNKRKSKFPDRNGPVSLSAKKCQLQHFHSSPKHTAQLENVQCAENHSDSLLWKVYPYITWSAQPFQNSLGPLQFSQGWKHGVSRDKAGPASHQVAFPMEFTTINTPAPENPSQETQPVSCASAQHQRESFPSHCSFPNQSHPHVINTYCKVRFLQVLQNIINII